MCKGLAQCLIAQRFTYFRCPRCLLIQVASDFEGHSSLTEVTRGMVARAVAIEFSGIVLSAPRTGGKLRSEDKRVADQLVRSART